MKKVSIILFVVLPFFLSAQNRSNFFEHTKIKIDKTQINTTNSDFGPSVVNDQLWYSAFTESDIKEMSEGKTKDIFYDSFVSPLDKNGNIKDGKQIKIAEISKGYHSGPVSYCAATKELFVTLSNFENPEIKNKVYRKADIRLKIIVLKETGNSWTLFEEMPFNDSTYSVGHPSISATGDTLFFSSNKPGTGLGQTDLYMSIRTNRKWGEPINLGDKINSPGNDMFPFLFQGNTLIFASNGKNNGESGLDMYYSILTKNGFSEPVELDKLNTESDDFGLIIHPNEEVGYFASNQTDGQGSDDIYKVEFEGLYNLELVVKDKITMIEIPNPKVKFDDNVSGVLKGSLITRELKQNSTYVATSEIEGYMNDSKSITTIGKPFGTIKETLLIEKVVVGQTFVMENIFYDFDKWDILPESEIELDKLVEIMNENPEWKVELGSHTDSRGSDSYNEILSQKRSDSAVGYIVSAGISKDRIVAKGYGESMLVNRCDDGVKCSEEEHRKNRRTEFKILDMGTK